MGNLGSFGFWRKFLRKENYGKTKRNPLAANAQFPCRTLDYRRREAMVVLGEDTLYRHKDEAVYIPVKTKHRIKNTSQQVPLTFIEIQTGDNLDEADIVRFEDSYGRVK